MIVAHRRARRPVRVGFAILVLLVTAACTGGSGLTTVSTTTTSTTTTTDLPTTTTPTTTHGPDHDVPTTVEPAQVRLDQMTLEHKIGQLLMPVLPGTVADAGAPSPVELVAEYHLGGVIYLGPNIESAVQLTALSAGLQAAAVGDSGIGMLVAVDQEGGRVVRIRDGVVEVPSARSLAGDADAVRTTAQQSAEGLRLQGINLVLAPVADTTDSLTNVIGSRSYGADPVLVADMVVAAIEGYRTAGVAMAVKHWPGHGSTEVDSHRSLPTIDRSLEEWSAQDRVPFVAAVAAGIDVVMVGHLAFPALDPTGAPATLSGPIVAGQLRDGLGFDGVVMTDALDMGAVSSVGPGDQAVLGLAAGVDILLAPSDLAAARDGIIEALADGRLRESQLDAAVLRILRLKVRLGLVAA